MCVCKEISALSSHFMRLSAFDTWDRWITFQSLCSVERYLLIATKLRAVSSFEAIISRWSGPLPCYRIRLIFNPLARRGSRRRTVKQAARDSFEICLFKYGWNNEVVVIAKILSPDIYPFPWQNIEGSGISDANLYHMPLLFLNSVIDAVFTLYANEDRLKFLF